MKKLLLPLILSFSATLLPAAATGTNTKKQTPEEQQKALEDSFYNDDHENIIKLLDEDVQPNRATLIYAVTHPLHNVSAPPEDHAFRRNMVRLLVATQLTDFTAVSLLEGLKLTPEKHTAKTALINDGMATQKMVFEQFKQLNQLIPKELIMIIREFTGTKNTMLLVPAEYIWQYLRNK